MKQKKGFLEILVYKKNEASKYLEKLESSIRTSKYCLIGCTNITLINALVCCCISFVNIFEWKCNIDLTRKLSEKLSYLYL